MRIVEHRTPSGTSFHVYPDSRQYAQWARDVVRWALHEKLRCRLGEHESDPKLLLSVGPMDPETALRFRARWGAFVSGPR